jgi:3-hydroxybenzoate 6-monooxygenase
VQLGSRLIGEYVYHPDGAKAEIRNASLQANSADDFYDGLDWLYRKPALSLSAAAARASSSR